MQGQRPASACSAGRMSLLQEDSSSGADIDSGGRAIAGGRDEKSYGKASCRTVGALVSVLRATGSMR